LLAGKKIQIERPAFSIATYIWLGIRDEEKGRGQHLYSQL
jgi:hypothetical protein